MMDLTHDDLERLTRLAKLTGATDAETIGAALELYERHVHHQRKLVEILRARSETLQKERINRTLQATR